MSEARRFSLKIPGGAPIVLSKCHTTVGGLGHDIEIELRERPVLFALHWTGDRVQLIPGEEKIEINGHRIKRASPLQVCDRVGWEGGCAVLLDNEVAKSSGLHSSASRKALEILSQLAQGFEGESSIPALLAGALTSLVETAGAEEGYLISEIDPDARTEWAVLASTHSGESTRKALVSNTILNQAVRSGEPIFIESLVGHPFSSQASIMGARIDSVACLPLRVADRVLGAVYLCSRTAGRAIRRETLADLTVLATQIALLRIFQSRHHRHGPAGSEAGTSRLMMRSASLRSLHDRLAKLAASELNLLVRGETGTGKELVAREIHQRSTRAAGPFVVVNCAAIPPSLIESILFGHVKGAYTGAQVSRVGKFQQAHGGTIFLDEIGELTPELQVRLLRVLQQKEVEAVGAERSVAVDFRVIAATHQDLDAAVASGRFRQDLFFRLNGATLTIPPLRHRGEDEIRYLAGYFLHRFAPGSSLTEDALRKLCEHSWPGNVRELEQVIARGAVLAEGDVITARDLELQESSVDLGTDPITSEISLGVLRTAGLKGTQRAFLRGMVERTLAQCQGNRNQAARQLGISERTLYRMLAADSSDKVH